MGCKANDQCCIQLSSVRGAVSLAEPVRIEAQGLLDEGGEQGEGSSAADVVDVLPRVPVQHVKRLGFTGLHLEPEYLADRLKDECAQLQLHFQESEMVSSGAEVMQLEIFQRRTESSTDGVRALLHVMGEDAEGKHCISFTRLSGDTFQFHKLYRTLRQRLCDLVDGTL